MRLLRTHTWAYITNIACVGLPDYIMTLITNIKRYWVALYHPNLLSTLPPPTATIGGVDSISVAYPS